jgi:hypothetical protein
MPTPAELASAAALQVSDEPPVIEAPDVGAISDFAWDIGEAMPAEHWVIEALAESLGYDPMAAFRFVRDHIRYEPYSGVLRGPEGTLAARAGNSLDRSLLLAALFDYMLVDYRFASGRLDDAALASVLEAARLGAPVALDAEPFGALMATERMGARARRDFARLTDALGPRFPTNAGTDEQSALEAARDHVWLRIPFGAETLDLDTTMPDAEPGDVLVADPSLSEDLAPDLHHEVALRLIVETLSDGVLSEEVVLERTLEAIDASERRIFVYFQPDLSGLGGAIVEVLSGDERWVPILLVDGEGEAGRSFSVGGRGTDLLGDETEAPDLVSARLEATTISPGDADQVATYVLFDRRPPGASRGSPGSEVSKDELEPLLEEAGAPLLMAGIYHVMVSTGGANPRTYAYRQSQVADFVASSLLDEEHAATFSFADRLWPLAIADEYLVIASEQVTVPASGGTEAHGYVARPRVYLTAIAPDPTDVSLLTMTTDLMLDGVRILPRTAGAATAQMHVWYGTLQSALETELGLVRVGAMADPGPRTFDGATFVTDEPLVVLTGDDLDTLTPDAHPSLRHDLASGRLVVAPGGPSAPASWWSIEPGTGVTQARISPGLRGYRDTSDRVPAGSERVLDTSKAKHNWGGPKRMTRPVGGPRPHIPGNYRPPPPPTTGGCPPNEYTIIVACVSLPAAILFWGVSLILVGVIIVLIHVWWNGMLCRNVSKSYC